MSDSHGEHIEAEMQSISSQYLLETDECYSPSEKFTASKTDYTPYSVIERAVDILANKVATCVSFQDPLIAQCIWNIRE